MGRVSLNARNTFHDERDCDLGMSHSGLLYNLSEGLRINCHVSSGLWASLGLCYRFPKIVNGFTMGDPQLLQITTVGIVDHKPGIFCQPEVQASRLARV